MTLHRYLRDTRAGATAIAAVAVTVMTIGGAALIGDHAWLVDQRDVLKTAADAAGIAATLEMSRLLRRNPDMSDKDLEDALKPVAERYIKLNLRHLPEDRLAQAVASLDDDDDNIKVTLDHAQRTVDVSVWADLGGTLFSRHMALLGNYAGPEKIRAETRVGSATNPIEVVLAIDMSQSMATRLDGSSGLRGWVIDDDGNFQVVLHKSRMDIVKDAAANLVAILDPNEDNRVAIGVVPWHQAVRLDPDAAADWSTNNWARYPRRRVYAEPYTCKGTCTPPAAVEQELAAAAPETWNGCLDSHRTGTVGTRASLPATSEFFTVPSGNAFAQRFFAAVQGASYECLARPLPADLNWQICYHGTRHTGYGDRPPFEPHYGCGNDTPAILPLSTDGDAIRQTFDSLAPVGPRTYSALGVLWGQRLLDHSWKNVWGDDVHPVDPAAQDSKGLRKAIVLLTDGEDTQCGFGNATCADSALGFSRTDACTAAKAAETEIFVIAAMHPDKVSEALGDSLRECSSESDNPDGSYAFLNNATPESLEAAFADIANQLVTVRRVY